MKKLIALIFVIMQIQPIIAQTVNVEGAFINSSITSEPRFYNSSVNKVAVGVFVDYFQHDYYEISSKIANYRMGGDGDLHLMSSDGVDLGNMRLNLSTLHLNTVFRAKLPINKFDLFLGVGPKLDYILSMKAIPENNDDNILSDKTSNRWLWGIEPECGVFYTLEPIKIGLKVSYNWSISDMKASEMQYKCRAFSVALTFGYIIK